MPVRLMEDASLATQDYLRVMSPPRPTRHELFMAAGCAVWAGVFLFPHWLWVGVLMPAYGVAVLPYRRAPVLAGYAVFAAELTQWALGVPGENPASGAAVVVTVFCLGRYDTRVTGVIPLALLAVAMAGRDGFAAPTAVFVTVLLGGIWLVGVSVRRRAEGARAAGRAVTDLAAADPVAAAARVGAEERARLAGEALGMVRAAVDSMRRQAEAADHDLDPVAVASIQTDGRRAVAELRRLLGLLRSEQPEPSVADAEPRAVSRPSWNVDALIAAGAMAIVLVETTTVASGADWDSVALTVALCASLALRRTDPSLACLAALVPMMVAVALDAPLLYGLEAPIVMTLLAWSVGLAARWRAYVALVALAVVGVVAVRRHTPGNEAILVLYVVGGVAGYLWGAGQREEWAALDTAAELRARHAAIADQAVRAERLRLARELHDVASHAIGVMVLQAAAADAHRTRDPTAARAALAAVRTAGAQALTELAALFGLLDAGAVGAPGLAATAPASDLASAVRMLVARMRNAGMDVSLTTSGDLAAGLVPAGTAYRVVQEALTNAARHAPGNPVTVQLARDAAALVIDVQDSGTAPDQSAPGFGLAGLAERVRAEGGEVAAGPRPEGGFAVSVRLPLQTPQPTSSEATA
jgi:signal transduction histidine kinase